MSEVSYDDIKRMCEDAAGRIIELQSRSHFPLPDAEGKNANITATDKVFRAAAETSEDDDDIEKIFLLLLCVLLHGENVDDGLLTALMYLLT